MWCEDCKYMLIHLIIQQIFFFPCFPFKSYVSLLTETPTELHSFRKWCYNNIEYTCERRDVCQYILYYLSSTIGWTERM